MIEIKNLCKSYSVPVYQNFNLNIDEGKITCILGESGSGKTTLLNCIAGLTGFTGDIPKLKCSYIFQTPRLVPSLTVYGNLALVCNDGQKITEMLEKVRLADKASSYPIALSGGQAQRVAIARAFLYGGDIILMDEPFSSLDLKLKKEIIELFLTLWRAEKKTALFVTHNVDEAVTLSERCLVIRSGNIVYDYLPQTSVPRNVEDGQEFKRQLIFALTN